MSLDFDINLISRVNLFSQFSPEQLRLLAFGSPKMMFREKHVIFRQGDKSDSGYIIFSGKVSMIQDWKGEETVLGEFGEGSLIGELALITQIERACSAVVSEKCEVMKITRATMQRILEEYPEVAIKLQKQIKDNILELTRDLPKIQAKLAD